MTSRTISLYSNIKQTKNGKDIPMDVLLDYIHKGQWQDEVLAVQTGKKTKEDLPYVTISGKFTERKVAGLQQHSGFICIDVDDVEPNELKSIVCTDKYLYCAFTSVSGKGVALIFKINPEKHNEAFEGLQEYLFDNYQIIIDPSCRDVSRARFISWDPAIYINDKAEKFAQYTSRKTVTKVPDVIFVKNDFESIIAQIVSKHIDITCDYNTWLRIGFSISDKFGEAGRTYFHQVSQFHPQYTPAICDRQYTNCLKANRNGVTIATFYYHAKQAGIEIVSEKTKIISQTAYLAKKGRRKKDETIKLLQDAENISPEESADIVNQVFESNFSIDTSDNPVEALELWLKQNYDLRRNVITRYIESGGRQLQLKDFNSIYIAAKKVFDKTNYELVERVINSDFTPEYNPILEFFEQHKSRTPSGAIKQLFDSIESDTGLQAGEFCPDYKTRFGTKWLVGMMSSVHGDHCPLFPVLCGNKQGTGKTEFWRRLLPKELKPYYAESKLDAGKDDEILMTQKMMIMDDEMGGKSKKESKRLKELTSKQTFSLREPYGRNNVDLQRLAMLCGTTNDNEILNDPTGNRRIVPINVISIDQDAYNKVDKVDVLMEAYHLFKSGFKWELTRDDVKILNDNTGYFEEISAEYDLVIQYYDVPVKQDEGAGAAFLTPTQIKSFLEKNSQQKLNSVRLGMEMKKLGWEKKARRVNGVVKKGFYVIEKSVTSVDGLLPQFFGSSGNAL